MSLKSWKEEFCPDDAVVAAKESDLAATEHCIKKWAGVSKEALAAHNMTKVSMRTCIQEIGAEKATAENAFWFDTESCALCQRIDNDGEIICADCIIYTATGGVCDDGPYADWHMSGKPTAMQNLLAITREYLLGHQDKDSS